MPKNELQRKINTQAPANAVIVGGGFMPSSTGISVREIAGDDGSTTKPDASGRVAVIGGSGIDVTATGTQIVVAVDGSIPRTTFPGQMIVSAGTTLLEDLPASGTFFTVADNSFIYGDIVLLQARGAQEYMQIADYGAPDAGGIAYGLTRSQNGTTAQAWRTGDIVLRLGQHGSVFMELAGQVDQHGTSGPTLTLKRMYGPTPADWTPVALLGNLAGHYGYEPEPVFGSGQYWGAGFGLYGVAGEPWVLIEAGAGVQLGRGGYLGLHLTPDGDIDQYTNAFQRSHLDADGSGWMVAPDTFFWDTAGNLTLDAGITARTLRIGPLHGPTLRGGSIIDYDANGNPLPDEQQSGHFGLWIEDHAGRRRVALLTGTEDWPDSPALYVGAPDDDSYLRYEGDRLEVKGTVVATAGDIGRFRIRETYLESVNQKVRLVAESSEDFGEGIVLIAGPTTADAGTVKWNDPNSPASRPNWTLGIQMCYFDQSYGGYVMHSQTSTPYGDSTTPTKHRWISGQWNGTQRAMEFTNLGLLVVPHVYTDQITAPPTSQLHLNRITWTKRLAGFSIQTNNGTVARIAEAQGGFEAAPVTQLPLNAAEVTINIPYEQPLGSTAHPYLIGLYVSWQKRTAGAYFAYIKLYAVNDMNGTRTEVYSASNVGQAEGTGRYNQTVIDANGGTPVQLAGGYYYLVLKTAGVSGAHDLLLHSVSCHYADFDPTA